MVAVALEIPLLNVDGGEHGGEPDELYALADVVHIACGGHAGDAVTMSRVITACIRSGTQIGAHPSYVDREGFGRRAMTVAPDILVEQVADQCSALLRATRTTTTTSVSVTSVKPHGALYHSAHADPAIARAVVQGIARAFGAPAARVAIVGLAGGALEQAARSAGHPYLREAFADRGVRPDGITLIPRGEPGALIDDPRAAADRARALMTDASVDTVCIHADTPSSLAIARAVREALGPRRRRGTKWSDGGLLQGVSGAEPLTMTTSPMTPFGDRAFRFSIASSAAHTKKKKLLASLFAVAGVIDVVLAESIGCVIFANEEDRTRAEPSLTKLLLDHTSIDDNDDAAPTATTTQKTHVIPVVYDGEDLDTVARTIGRSVADIIALHAEREYHVAMLGFLPGFAYLRGLPEVLCLPRRAPRPRVPAGAVAIAADYTGIYPFASPGGWHLLGRAIDFEAFSTESGATLAIGDAVRFSPSSSSRAEDKPKRPQRAQHIPEGPHLEITRAAGIAISVDGGRAGRMHEGVPPGGPLVHSRLARANALVGNDSMECAIELSGTLEITARGGSVTVATDRDAENVVLQEGESHVASSSGERVRYLAIAGGIDAPIVLGGRGALLVAGIGGLLRKGDRISIASHRSTDASSLRDDDDDETKEIAIVPGPDVVGDLGAIETSLCSITFRITHQSDRTGTRLDPSPMSEATSSLPRSASAPMIVGAIELTPSGLIVFGPDHPTTGGYPVVAVIHSASLDHFFSRPIGSTVRFTV